MTIEGVFAFLRFLSNKSQTGSISPSEYNIAAERAQMQIFERDYRIWLETGKTTDALITFLVANYVQVVPVTGFLPEPSNYAHIKAIRRYYARPNGKSIEVPVVEVDDEEWGDMQQSEIAPPTLRYPKYRAIGGEFEFRPRNVGSVYLDYFRRPTTPVWAYTVVNGRPVYDPVNSVDFELPDEYRNEVTAIICSYVGINLRETPLEQWAQMFKAETQTN